MTRPEINTLITFAILSFLATLFYASNYPDSYSFSSTSLAHTIVYTLTITYQHIAIHLFWSLTIIWTGHLIHHQIQALNRLIERINFWSIFDIWISYRLYRINNLNELYIIYTPGLEPFHMMISALFIGCVLATIYFKYESMYSYRHIN